MYISINLDILGIWAMAYNQIIRKSVLVYVVNSVEVYSFSEVKLIA
jgi:hypothetical protein